MIDSNNGFDLEEIVKDCDSLSQYMNKVDQFIKNGFLL